MPWHTTASKPAIPRDEWSVVAIRVRHIRIRLVLFFFSRIRSLRTVAHSAFQSLRFPLSRRFIPTAAWALSLRWCVYPSLPRCEAPHALTSMLTVASLTAALGRQGSLAPHLQPSSKALKPTLSTRCAVRHTADCGMNHTLMLGSAYLPRVSCLQAPQHWAARNTTTPSGR